MTCYREKRQVWKLRRSCYLNLLPQSYNECNKTSFLCVLRNMERHSCSPTLISFQVHRCSTSWLQKLLSMCDSDCPICFLLFAAYKDMLVCPPIYHHFLILLFATSTMPVCWKRMKSNIVLLYQSRNILIKYFQNLNAVWTHERDPCSVQYDPFTLTHSTSITNTNKIAPRTYDKYIGIKNIRVDSPGKNTGVGCHSPLQRIFLTAGSNPSLWHYRQILYHL